MGTEEVKAGDLHKLLMGCTHNGFPVVRDGRQVGVIERDMLHFLLNYGEKYGIFEADPRIIHHSFTSFYIVKTCPPLAPFDHIEAVSDKLVDLRPYLSKSYTTMQSDASLYACYNIFRGLGLRHLFIHDEGTGKVSGVVTRKDLIRIEDPGMGKSDPLQRASANSTLLVSNGSPAPLACLACKSRARARRDHDGSLPAHCGYFRTRLHFPPRSRSHRFFDCTF